MGWTAPLMGQGAFMGRGAPLMGPGGSAYRSRSTVCGSDSPLIGRTATLMGRGRLWAAEEKRSWHSGEQHEGLLEDGK